MLVRNEGEDVEALNVREVLEERELRKLEEEGDGEEKGEILERRVRGVVAIMEGREEDGSSRRGGERGRRTRVGSLLFLVSGYILESDRGNSRTAA